MHFSARLDRLHRIAGLAAVGLLTTGNKGPCSLAEHDESTSHPLSIQKGEQLGPVLSAILSSAFLSAAFCMTPDRYTGKHEDIKVPVILWWTPFTKEPGRTKACSNRSCFFTEDRAFFNHTRLYVSSFESENMFLCGKDRTSRDV